MNYASFQLFISESYSWILRFRKFIGFQSGKLKDVSFIIYNIDEISYISELINLMNLNFSLYIKANISIDILKFSLYYNRLVSREKIYNLRHHRRYSDAKGYWNFPMFNCVTSEISQWQIKIEFKLHIYDRIVTFSGFSETFISNQQVFIAGRRAIRRYQLLHWNTTLMHHGTSTGNASLRLYCRNLTYISDLQWNI